jgi:DnaJ-class molecular chaperone
LLKRSKQKDYYKLLGVSKTANDREIKQAFKKLALQLHPDKIGNLPEAERTEKEKQFREIAEAYEVLSDAEKRGKYDRGEDVEPNQGGQQQQQQHPFHHFFQQGGPFGGGGGGGQGFTFHFG